MKTRPNRRMQTRDVNDVIARVVRERLNALGVAPIHHGPLIRDLQDEVWDMIFWASLDAARDPS